MTPTVSVIIPTYNSAHVLPEAIASVQAQGWPSVEIIVVDDGSTDNTETVVDAIARGGANVLFLQQENAGAAAARNTGIAAATGDWIAFLDADDVWLPDKLHSQFAALEKHGEASFSYTDITLRFKTGKESDVACGTQDRPLLIQLLGGNLFATPTVMVRRDCLHKVGLFDPRLRTGEDWDLWLRLAAHFDHVRVPRPLSRISVAGETRFPIAIHEQCTLLTLQRLVSCRRVQRDWPRVAAKERLIYSWHYSVLAKSYLRHGRPFDFCRLASRATVSHAAGFYFLAGAPREVLEARV